MGASSSSQAVFNYDHQLLSDTKPQSVEFPTASDGEYKTSTVPRRSAVKTDIVSIPFPDEVNEAKEPLATNVWGCFQRAVKKFPDNPCLGTREFTIDSEEKKTVVLEDKAPKRGKFVWDTYKEVDEAARSFGAGLIDLGAKAGENIGIYSSNRAEWQVTALGCYSQNLRVVSLYATLGEDAIEYISNHAELRFIITEQCNMGYLIKVLPKLKTVTHIIQYDANAKYHNIHEGLSEEQIKIAAEKNIKVLAFSAVIKQGAEKAFPNPPQTSDLCMIMYTSGTTGNPKGVMLTHSNLAAAVATVPYFFELKNSDAHLSFLPLAHIFEAVVEVAVLSVGGSIGFFQNNIKKLTDDWIELKPTFIIGVPRVFQRVYQKVMDGVKQRHCIVRMVFNKHYNAVVDSVRNGTPRPPSADSTIFGPMREKLGWSRVRGIITGAAPCPPYLVEFLKVVTGAVVMQGYGMTESTAGVTVTRQDDVTIGHCGPPVPNSEVKLVDVPDMDYLHTDNPPRGEVAIRGPAVFQGYFKDDAATASTIIDGWLHTGDIGRFNPNGTLSIIDRKKNMFKLSQGEYVAAEKVEAQYSKASAIGQLWVYGNSFKSFLLAVVVPSGEFIAGLCQTNGWWPRSKEATKVGDADFIADFKAVFTGPHAEELKAAVFASMKEQEKPLKAFERITDFIIEYDINNLLMGFTEQNGCLTPTFKLRRPQLLQRYILKLKELYAKHGEPVGADEKWPGEP